MLQYSTLTTPISAGRWLLDALSKLMLAFLFAVASGTCPAGFTEYPPTGRCYTVPDTYASHQGCTSVCDKVGGGLACL